ncbi:MAG: nucleotidyltransferase domain-containing protein [Thermoprotei archaeon]|nr:nucleotidyltransferase domain-containing protein [Thermoprotei archaeon]
MGDWSGFFLRDGVLISYLHMISCMLARWLGERYLKLLDAFHYRVFSLSDACRVLNEGRARVRVVLSELCRRGWAYRLKRGWYVVFSPYVMLIRGGWEGRVRQRVYLPLILSVSTRLIEWLDGGLVSVAIFGSVARGEARPNSDLDVLVVAEGMPEEYSRRVDIAVSALDPLKDLKIWLWENAGIYCNVELLMLAVEEARRFQPVYLDMVHSSIIVYDRGGFLRGVLERLAERLRELGAERIELPGGRWFWRLKPEVERGEVIEI